MTRLKPNTATPKPSTTKSDRTPPTPPTKATKGTNIKLTPSVVRKLDFTATGRTKKKAKPKRRVIKAYDIKPSERGKTKGTGPKPGTLKKGPGKGYTHQKLPTLTKAQRERKNIVTRQSAKTVENALVGGLP